MAALTRQQLAVYFKSHDLLKAAETALEKVYPEGSTGIPTLAEADAQRLIMKRLRTALRKDVEG